MALYIYPHRSGPPVCSLRQYRAIPLYTMERDALRICHMGRGDAKGT